MDFDEATVQRVWEKGQVVPGVDSNEWRKDQCTAWINRNRYGNRNSDYGWEIDHIKPKERGGTDDMPNLRPLQWENNASKQDGRLTCPIRSDGNKNVRAG